MTKKEIQERKLYLDTLKTQLLLEDNAAVTSEMTARAKQIEGILKALISANVNCDNIPGMEIYVHLEKNLVIKKKSDGTDQILVASANINKFAKGEELNTRNNETYILMKQEFSKVLDQINSCLNYYQIDNIKVIDEYDKPISKIWIKLIPSDNYLDYLNKIKFIPYGKFFAKKK